MSHRPIVLPPVRAALRHALPSVVQGKLVPLALFLGALEFVGTIWALLVAMGWSLGVVVRRWSTGRRVPGLVVLGTVTLTARTIAALVTGSMVVYFLQPTITTAFVGLAFLVSVPLGRPLARRLADDLFPLDDETRSHPVLEQFFVRLSLVWAVTSLINASITLWLLMTQSTTTFVLVKSLLGPATTTVTVGSMLVWLWIRTSRAGIPIIRHQPVLSA